MNCSQIKGASCNKKIPSYRETLVHASDLKFTSITTCMITSEKYTAKVILQSMYQYFLVAFCISDRFRYRRPVLVSFLNPFLALTVRVEVCTHKNTGRLNKFLPRSHHILFDIHSGTIEGWWFRNRCDYCHPFRAQLAHTISLLSLTSPLLFTERKQ